MKESCSILDNLEEAIVCRLDGVVVSINYCNNLTLQIFNKIYQKCVNDNIGMPPIDDINQYLASKKQFINSEDYSEFDAFIMKFRIFELYQQE